MLAHERGDWLFAFWSSLTLELLARGTLAYVSPVLLADPEDWNNIYYALGRTPTASKFSPKSIQTNKVLNRMRQILPEFGKELEDFCALHTGRRNAEVHSAETPFTAIKESEWLPSFYRACDILLKSVDSTLAEFLGEAESLVAEKLIKAAADEAAKAVAGDIAAHQRVWNAKSEVERIKLVAQADLWANRHIGHVVNCPACKSKALLYGEPIAPPVKSIVEDEITEMQAFLPSRFECIACGLRISSLSQLGACGLGDSFKRTSTYDAASYYVVQEEDDEDEGQYEDDNNEPF